MKKILILITFFYSLNVFSQWSEITLPTNSGLNDVFFVDENIGYLVGGGDVYGYSNTTDGIIFKTEDGGNSWTSLYTQNKYSFNYVFVIDDTISVYGRNSQQQPIIKQSVDEGLNWSETLANHNIDFMDFSNNNIYYLDPEGSNILLKRKTNGNIITISNDAAVFGVNNNEIIYINNQFDSIFKSVDCGENWLQLAGLPPGYGSNQMTFSKIKPFGDKLIIHYTYPNFVAYSLDNGINWTEVMDDNPVNITSIVNENTLYGIYGNKIYVNSNYENWIEQSAFNQNIRKIFFYDNDLGFAIGENGTMYRTENGGGLTVSENNILEKKIKVYPVPSINKIQIEIPNDLQINNLNLYDMNGRLVKTYKSTERILKVCKFSVGNYLLKIETNQGNVTKKIVIE